MTRDPRRAALHRLRRALEDYAQRRHRQLADETEAYVGWALARQRQPVPHTHEIHPMGAAVLIDQVTLAVIRHPAVQGIWVKALIARFPCGTSVFLHHG